MTEYDLKSLSLPSLSGNALRLFAAALDSPLSQSLLISRLFQEAGIEKLRAMKLDEPPTVFPYNLSPEATSQPDDGPSSLALATDDAMKTGTEMPFRTITDYADAYRSRKLTPEDVAQRLVEAITASEAIETPLKAFIAVDREDLMEQARVSTQRIRDNNPLSVLDGVPVAIKDELDQTPYPTTVGTSFLGKIPAAKDSAVAARLRAAGALLIGKTNMYEIGISPEGFNLHYGTVPNPYDPAHDSGGSSSGSGAAVAAGFCPVAIGADGGGSIRIPASHCGLVGLKATFGRVSSLGGSPIAWSLDHYGPIGCSVADVVLAYAAIAGPEAGDPATHYGPAVALDNWLETDLSDLTLGVYWPWFRHAEQEVVSTCMAMLDTLVQAGAGLKEIELPELDGLRIAHAVTFLAEASASMRSLKANWGDFSAPARINLALGRALTAFDYVQAQRMRTRAMTIFSQAMVDVDIIITPASAVSPPRYPEGQTESGWSDNNVVTELMRYVIPGNMTGLPAISFPAGYAANGLPIGVQAMGRPWRENDLFRVALAAEKVVERRRPQIFYDLLD